MPDQSTFPGSADKNEIGVNVDVLREVLAPVLEDRCWMIWTPMPRPGGFAKLPADPETGYPSPKNNSAMERGVLTFDEAVAAATMWKVNQAGIGIVPGHATSAQVVALDFDLCIKSGGKIRDSIWDVIGGGESSQVYLETSPSTTGLRGLVTGVDPKRFEEVGNGAEIGSCGVYYGSSRFVTVTGMIYDGPTRLVEGDQVVERAITRMKKVAAEKGVTGGLLPYSGDAGVREALLHIASGAALHEPLMWLSARWAGIGWDEDAIHERLVREMKESAEKDSARWLDRMENLPRWTKNAVKKFGGNISRFTNTQGCQHIKGIIERTQARQKAAIEDHHEEVTVAESEGRVLPKMKTGKFIAPPATDDEELAEMLDVWGECREAEFAATRYDPLTPETLPQSDYQWAFDELGEVSVWMAETARHVMATMSNDLPGAAVLTALHTVSTVTRNGYVAMGQRPTALHLYSGLAAASGTGKGAVIDLCNQAADIAGSEAIGSLKSESGLHEALIPGKDEGGPESPAPALTCVLDEWGLVMAEVASGKATYKTGCMTFLLGAYSIALGKLGAARYSNAVKNKPAVFDPYTTIMGVSTMVELKSALNMRMVANGFLPRHLIVMECFKKFDDKPASHRYPFMLPDHLDEALRAINMAPTRNGRMQATFSKAGPKVSASVYAKEHLKLASGREVRKVYLTAEQEGGFKALQRRLTAKYEAVSIDGASLGDLANRAAENAIKIAALLRIGDVDEAFGEGFAVPLHVTDAQAAFAVRLVEQMVTDLGDRMVALAEEETSSFKAQRKVVEAVHTIIAKGDQDAKWGPHNRRGYMSQRQITHRTTRLSVRERGEAISVLEELGFLVAVPDEIIRSLFKTKGPTPVVWAAATESEEEPVWNYLKVGDES